MFVMRFNQINLPTTHIKELNFIFYVKCFNLLKKEILNHYLLDLELALLWLKRGATHLECLKIYVIMLEQNIRNHYDLFHEV
jgi:hypothetical protein